MPDREKVIKAIECCMNLHGGDWCPLDCPYIEKGRVSCGQDVMLADALALLKEQAEVIDRYHKADVFLSVHGWRWEDA